MTNKITKRDNYNELRNLVATSTMDTETTERMLAFIDHEIELLDKRAESSKKYVKKTVKAEDELSAAILNTIIENGAAMTIPEIVTVLAAEDATQQKVTYRLTKLVEAGTLVKDVRSVKEEGKAARKICFYSVPADTEAE